MPLIPISRGNTHAQVHEIEEVDRSVPCFVADFPSRYPFVG